MTKDLSERLQQPRETIFLYVSGKRLNLRKIIQGAIEICLIIITMGSVEGEGYKSFNFAFSYLSYTMDLTARGKCDYLIVLLSA